MRKLRIRLAYWIAPELHDRVLMVCAAVAQADKVAPMRENTEALAALKSSIEEQNAYASQVQRITTDAISADLSAHLGRGHRPGDSPRY